MDRYRGAMAISMHGETLSGHRVRRAVKRVFRPAYAWGRDAIGSVVDRRFGIDTTGEIHLSELGLPEENRKYYIASGWTVLRRMLPARAVVGDDVFIDFGSGKGRVVYQASVGYPFKRVIGVEISEALNAVARRNIEQNRHRLRCPDVELVTCDVVDYDIPDDVTIAYFNDPFNGEIFAAAVDKLVESLNRRPRPLRVIYRVPVDEAYLLGTGRFRLVKETRGLRPGRRWSSDTSVRMYLAGGPGPAGDAPV